VHLVSFIEDGDWLDAIFLKREHRKVKADGTITLNKQLYEVPPRFIGQSIELRYDERGVYVYEDGRKVAEAVRVRLEDNAYVKRHRSPFAGFRRRRENTVYKSFYSLSREPFAKETDPSEAYQGAPFQEALRALEYVKRTRGIGLLIGEPGAGKTFALRALKESLNPSLYHVVYFPLSTGGVMDFYRGLALGLGEEPKYRKVDLFRQIQQAIERLYHVSHEKMISSEWKNTLGQLYAPVSYNDFSRQSFMSRSTCFSRWIVLVCIFALK
jgi:hypothetical protein